jgi:ATP-binding cassette subfamily C protein LapB
LLCGLYPPGEGSIFIDGIDSRQYSPLHLRSAMRFVGQDAALFSGSIKQNLRVGAPAVDDDRLIEVLRQIGADRFMGQDSSGLDRATGERGSQLSGGQRNFLATARALAVPSKLLFLDEPTGAMDVQSERRFVADLSAALHPGQTLVVATHREAILQICDRIIIIDEGRIIADGPRAEIMARADGGGSTP